MKPQDKNKATVFIGGGRITGALLAGLRLAGDQRRVVVYDRHPEKLKALRRESGAEIERDLESALASAEMLIVAVRPSSVAEAIEEISSFEAQLPRLCVSLAAGIPLKALRGRIGSPMKWVRAMPSPVSRVGRGLTALCFDRGWSTRDKKAVRQLFARVGTVIEVPEHSFDAFTVTYSSSHGYHALKALSDAARQAGLKSKIALVAAAHALGDAIWYWRESGLSLDELLHEAATPGGIAAATMRAMDRAGYARVVSQGIKAGMGQAKENARR